MTERQKLTLSQKIAELQQLTKALRSLQKKIDRKQFLAEDFVRRAIERYLQLSIEATLDISDQIINEENLRKPTEYKDNILILGEQGILPKSFAARFSRAAGFRNILVHDYVRLDKEKVYEHFKKDVVDIEKFIKAVLIYLKKH